LLKLVDEKESKNNQHNILIVDLHAHLGNDIDGAHNMLSPRVPGGLYDFVQWVTYGTADKKGIIPELLEDKKNGENKYRYHLDIENSLKNANKTKIIQKNETYTILSEIYPEIKELTDSYWLFDEIVVFPMKDVFSTRDGNFNGPIEYVPSVANITRWANNFPDSLKLVGYARYNPEDLSFIKDFDDIKIRDILKPQEGSVYKELEKAITLHGLQGLKLHPHSDSFHADNPRVVSLIIQAAILNIPITFDCRSIGVEKRIYNSVNNAIVFLYNHNAEFLIPRIRVVIAHFGWHITYKETFEILAHPNIYGDLSASKGKTIYALLGDGRFQSAITRDAVSTVMVDIEEKYSSKSNDVPLVFKEEALKRFKNRKKRSFLYSGELDSVRWSDKIVFGSDYPFIGVWQSIEIILALLSNELSIDPVDLKKVLGVSALKILKPKYCSLSEQITNPKTQRTYNQFVLTDNFKSTIEKLKYSGYYPLTIDNLLKYDVSINRISEQVITRCNRIENNSFIITLFNKKTKDYISLLSLNINLYSGKRFSNIVPLQSKDSVAALGQRFLYPNELSKNNILRHYFTNTIAKE